MSVGLTLVCQAPTAATRAATFPADEPADTRWLSKAGGLGPRLSRPRACFTSPALAAQQTAVVVGLPTVVDPALRDCDYGRWAGLSLESVLANEPDALSLWLTDPASRPHGGETLDESTARAAAWLGGIERCGRMVAVAPATIIKGVVLTVLGAPASAFFRLDVSPLSFTRLRWSGTTWSVMSVNQRFVGNGSRRLRHHVSRTDEGTGDLSD